jgi:hypothetical protein
MCRYCNLVRALAQPSVRCFEVKFDTESYNEPERQYVLLTAHHCKKINPRGFRTKGLGVKELVLFLSCSFVNLFLNFQASIGIKDSYTFALYYTVFTSN